MKTQDDIQARLTAYRSTKVKQKKQDPGGLAIASNHTRVEADKAKIRQLESTQDPPSSNSSSPWYIVLLKVILWLLLWGLFIEVEFGVVFLVASALYFMYVSLKGSRRKSWEPSAYSVFNKNFEAIEGTLTAEQFERELRFGAASVKKTDSE